MKHPNSIIRAVQLTEKGESLGHLRKYFVEVDRAANKYEIKQAVQDLFNVTVLDVNTLRRKGETRTLRNRRTIVTPEWKRAIVTLKEGDRIDVI
jgi:large subunit ribosomal protein L23